MKKTAKMIKAQGRRGHLRYHTEGHNSELVTVCLGEPHDPESEHILTIHSFYLDELIALLSLARDSE